jgi:hypothetical protein
LEPRKKSQKKEEKKIKGKLKKLTQRRDRRSDASEDESHDSEERFVVDDDEEVEEDEWSDSERERVLGEDEARRRRKEEERIRAADKEEVKRKRLAREKKKKQVEEQATKRAGVVDDEEEEEEPVKSQKAKRTKTRTGKITNKKRRKHSDEDEGPEDLEILDEETVIDQRLRGSISTVASKFEQIRAARASETTDLHSCLRQRTAADDPCSLNNQIVIQALSNRLSSIRAVTNEVPPKLELLDLPTWDSRNRKKSKTMTKTRIQHPAIRNKEKRRLTATISSYLTKKEISRTRKLKRNWTR